MQEPGYVRRRIRGNLLSDFIAFRQNWLMDQWTGALNRYLIIRVVINFAVELFFAPNKKKLCAHQRVDTNKGINALIAAEGDRLISPIKKSP